MYMNTADLRLSGFYVARVHVYMVIQLHGCVQSLLANLVDESAISIGMFSFFVLQHTKKLLI